MTDLAHAHVVIAAWRRESNDDRPKKGFVGLTPAAYTLQLTARTVKPSTTHTGWTSARPWSYALSAACPVGLPVTCARSSIRGVGEDSVRRESARLSPLRNTEGHTGIAGAVAAG